jgi:predicted  nucleic acid-binding Zn-ribbon protein
MFNIENQDNDHFNLDNSGDNEEDNLISLSPSSSIDDQQIILRNKIETFDDKELNKLYDNWLELDAEMRIFEPKHKEYVTKLDQVESLKTKYRNEFNKYNKRIHQLQKDVARLRKSYIKKG